MNKAQLEYIKANRNLSSAQLVEDTQLTEEEVNKFLKENPLPDFSETPVVENDSKGYAIFTQSMSEKGDDNLKNVLSKRSERRNKSIVPIKFKKGK